MCSKQLDVIIPVYNEEHVVVKFHQELIKVINSLDLECRMLYVDDGSSDGTLDHLMEISRKDNRVNIIELSRNFGHQAALSAGLTLADGDYIIMMDGDGQHPPELIPEMIALARKGNDIVLTKRQDQRNLGRFKRWTSSLFYKLINFMGSTQLEARSADFRLLNSRALLALRCMPEYHRFLRGMVAWMGFKTTTLSFIPHERLSGTSKYSISKMFRMALDATFSFSLMPLYFAMMVGIVFLVLSIFEIIYVLSFWILGRTDALAPGWASLMFIVLFSSGTILVTLGIIGAYIGYIFQEVKRRPVYLIRAVHNNQNTENAR